ncbi:MAG: hypothetical protein Tsb002_09510 [Wenzhouxiangellaceae bacterium]
MPRLLLNLIAFLLTAAAALPVAAQVGGGNVQVGYPSQARGVDAGAVYSIDGQERINMFNGNVVLQVPLGVPYPLNGGNAYQLAMTYNSNAWDPVPAHSSGCLASQFTAWRPADTSNAGLGWSLSFGRLLPKQSGLPSEYVIENSGNKQFWVYEKPDGSRLPIMPPDSVWQHVEYTGDYQLVGPEGRIRFIERTPDLRIDLEFPDGAIHEFTNIGTAAEPKWRATKIYYGHHSFNNYIQIDYQYTQNHWVITDSLSRSHTIRFSPSNSVLPPFSRIEQITLAGADGNTLVYDLHSVSKSIPMHRAETNLRDLDGPACTENAILETASRSERYPDLTWNYQVDLLQRIKMPDGMFYQFYYHASDFQFGKSGILKQIRYPTGLRGDYQYSLPDRTLGLPEDYQSPDTVGNGNYIFQFNYDEVYREFKAANSQSGLRKKTVFELDESAGGAAINWQDIYLAPAPGLALPEQHYGEYRYTPAMAGYMAQPDQEWAVDHFRPCYSKRTMTDPLGRTTEYFYNNIGYLNLSVSPRVGLPFAMCDPLLEHSISQTDLGLENYFGRGVAGHQIPTSATSHRYAANGSGPFLSRLYRDENGHIIRSEWVTIENITSNDLPMANHTVTLTEETRFHDHQPGQCTNGHDSYNCYPVVAWRSTEYQQYDGFGHFARVEKRAQRKVGNNWINWGNGNVGQTNFQQWRTRRYQLTTPESAYYTFDYQCTNVLRFGGCPQFTGAAPQFNDATAWWQLDSETRLVTGDTSNGESTTEYCRDNSTGVITGVRNWAGTSRQPNDLLTIKTLAVTPSRNGNIASITRYGGDTATLDTDEACPTPTELFFAREEISYQHGVAIQSRHLDCDGQMISESALLTPDPTTGWITRSTDPTGVSINYEFDIIGRLVRSKSGGKSSTYYDYRFPTWANGIVAQAITLDTYACIQDQNCTIANAETHQQSQFDARGLIGLTSIQRESGQGHAYQHQLFDLAGRLTEQSVWSNSAANAARASKHQYDYDALDRLLSATAPDGSQTIQFYSQNGEWEQTISRMVAMDDGEEQVTHIQYSDAYGRLIMSSETSSADSDPTPDAEINSSYHYDELSNLTLICINDNDSNPATCASGQLRKRLYDGRSLLTKEWHPELHIGTYSSNDQNDATAYQYDGAGRVLTQNAPGTEHDLRYVYDSAGRIVQIRELSGQQRLLTEYTYSPVNDGANRAKQRLHQAKQHHWIPLSPGGTPEHVTVTERYSYTAADGLFSNYSVSTSLGSYFTASISAYDSLGNIQTIQQPQCHGACADAPRTITYQYDNGVLVGIPNYLDSITYHPDQTISHIAHADGVDETYNKDLFGWRLEQIDTTPINWTHGPIRYDGSGQIKQIGQDTFSYDGLGRLRHGESTADNGQQYQQIAEYDAFGNITNLRHGDANELPGNLDGPSITVDPATNRLTGSNTVYDAAGHLLRHETDAGTYTNSYDTQGRLIHTQSDDGLGSFSYLYTAAGERLATLHLHNDRIVWTPRNSNHQLQRRFVSNLALTNWQEVRDYVYAGNKLIAIHPVNATSTHVHSDHLGSTRRVTQSSGSLAPVIIDLIDYLPYGQAIESQADQPAIQFAGHERDELDVIEGAATRDYMHARHYLTDIGRFLSVDPKLGSPGASQSWNRYTYARNNPVNRLDPDGKRDDEPTAEMLAQNEPLSIDEGCLPGYGPWCIHEEVVVVDDSIDVVAEMPSDAETSTFWLEQSMSTTSRAIADVTTNNRHNHRYFSSADNFQTRNNLVYHTVLQRYITIEQDYAYGVIFPETIGSQHPKNQAIHNTKLIIENIASAAAGVSRSRSIVSTPMSYTRGDYNSANVRILRDNQTVTINPPQPPPQASPEQIKVIHQEAVDIKFPGSFSVHPYGRE